MPSAWLLNAQRPKRSAELLRRPPGGKPNSGREEQRAAEVAAREAHEAAEAEAAAAALGQGGTGRCCASRTAGRRIAAAQAAQVAHEAAQRVVEAAARAAAEQAVNEECHARMAAEQEAQRQQQVLLALPAPPVVARLGRRRSPRAYHRWWRTIQRWCAKTSRVLAKHQYQTVLAEDGLDALRQIEQALPDVLITDVEMPGLTAWNRQRCVRADARTASIPIIMVTFGR
ncbi:MAG: response regulator [Ideonella sp.]|nr:response regulator [Ideonella sp.]